MYYLLFLVFVLRENRYLLLLTKNYEALPAMLRILHNGAVKLGDFEPFVLFGSSFPKDRDYVQVQHVSGVDPKFKYFTAVNKPYKFLCLFHVT